MREDRRTRVSLAAPQSAVGNVGGRAGGLNVVGPFTETARGRRKAAVPRAEAMERCWI